ncbi:hypothetical protein, partial [Xenorhabdus littoralis]|uniref:hypothetical protein n=1 Tax=Xenorhabdus littoralis TaxID=2582835 RepID=UPI0029E7D53D
KDKEFTPPNGTVTADGKTPYIFTPVITFDTANNAFLQNVSIDNVQWTTEPPIGEESGLKWGKPAPTTATNDKGQLEAALVSSKPVREAKIFLQAGGMEKTQVGAVSFGDNSTLFHIETVDVSPKVPSQVADGKKTYTYTATVLGGDGKPAVNQKISNVKWSIDKDNKELIWAPPNGDVTTNEKGE